MEAAKSAITNLMGYNKEEDADTTGTTGTSGGTNAHTTTDRTVGDDTLGGHQTSSNIGSASAHHATTTGTTTGTTSAASTGTHAGADSGLTSDTSTGHHTGHSTGAPTGASTGATTSGTTGTHAGAGTGAATSGASTGATREHTGTPGSTGAGTGASSTGSSAEHKSTPHDTEQHKSGGHHLHNPLHLHKSHEKSGDSLETERSHAQSPNQGRDPAVVGDDGTGRKLTGTAAPGSHSAVFGLTPSGEKVTETKPGSGTVKPANELGKPSKERGSTTSGDHDNDTSSRAPAGGKELGQQMHNPADQGPKGLERTDPVPRVGASDSDKPGAGGVGLKQETGDVRP